MRASLGTFLLRQNTRLASIKYIDRISTPLDALLVNRAESRDTVNRNQNLVSQNVIPTINHFGGTLPFAFTEQSVAMLSAVLNSEYAVRISVKIMRAF